MFKLPTTNAFSKYVLCIYSVLLKRLSPQQLRCCLPFLYIYSIKIKNAPQLCKMPHSSLPSLLFTPQSSLKFFTHPSTAKHFGLPGSCRNGERKLPEITGVINQLPTFSQRPPAPESGSGTWEMCQSQILPSELCQSKP